jgi:flagella synthesis protein FlgN
MQAALSRPLIQLASELDAARALRDCLVQERECLIRAEIETLQELATRKTALVEEMNALAASRAMALAALGQTATAAGMAAWLETQGQGERDAWSELLALAEEGRELNRVNGLLIHGHIGRNGAALQVLRGSDQAAVYGRNGQQAVASSGRAIVAG